MRGSFKIDDYNSYERWGCVMTKGSYKALLTFPDVKNIKTNDWNEENYVETYTAEAKRKAREITLNFAFVGENSDCFGFVEYLKKDKREITVDEFCGWYTTKLRVKSFSNFYNNDGNFRMLTVRFAEDAPNMYDVHESVQISKKYGNRTWRIAGNDTHEWNAYVLGETVNEAMRPNDMKQNLTIEVDDMAESYYFENDRKEQSKTIELDILMRADSLAELFNCYSKFFADVVNRNTLVEVSKSSGDIDLNGYVSGSTCTDIDINNKRVRFSVIFEIVGKEARRGEYLTTEDGYRIITEQGEKIIIL